MSSAGEAYNAIDQPSALRADPLFLPFEQLPERDYNRVPRPRPKTETGAQAPLYDENQYRFTFDSKFEGIRFRSISRDPNSYGLATPLDAVTSLPLPIVIIDPPANNRNTDPDYHHHYHPKRDLLDVDDATLALRRSRGQYLPRWLHEHYHHYFSGPEFPGTRKDMYASVVLACAGVVPRMAIDFSGLDGPKIVEVNDNKTYQRIVSSVMHEGEKRTASSSFYRSQIGIFFANYAIEQSFEEVVSKRVVNEFLETKNMQQRKELGNLMLREAIILSVEPVIPIHRGLKKEGISHKRKTDLRGIVSKFFVTSRRPDYYNAIDQKLSVA